MRHNKWICSLKKKSQALSETPSSNEKDEEDNVVSIAAHKRAIRKNRGFPPELPRREVIISAKDKQCQCDKEKKVIRYETTEILDYQPAVFEVIVQKREVVVCLAACQDSMETASNPKRILPKVNITENLLAYIIVSKMEDRQPLYHFEKQLESRFGILCRCNKLARWFIEVSKAVQPLINLLKERILDYDVASCDPTSIQVLKEPGRLPTQKSYAYCIRGGPPDQRVTVYDYNAENHKLFLANWFEGFKGYLHVDAQNIFEDLEKSEDITLL